MHQQKQKSHAIFYIAWLFVFMVGPARFELATNGSKVLLTIKHSCGFPWFFGNKGMPDGRAFIRLRRLYSHQFQHELRLFTRDKSSYFFHTPPA